MKFWFGETVSLVGSQITYLALPLTAVLTFGASSGQVGLVRFLEYLPFILFTLVFGVWVDRRRRRPIMLFANAGRAAAIAVISILLFLDVLRIEVLYFTAFGVGTLTVLFDLCWMSYVPALVSKEQLVEANGKIASSYAAAEVAGPGLAGALLQAMGPARVLLLDAVSYAVSLVTLASIRKVEDPPPATSAARGSIRRDVADGVRFVFGNGYLRALALQGAIYNFSFVLAETIFLLYTVRTLGFTAALLGVVLSAGAVGGLIGSATATAVARRTRLGPLIVGALAVSTLPMVLVPAITGEPGVLAIAFMAIFFVVRCGSGVWNVLSLSIRQAVTSNEIRGRMNASMRLLLYGAASLGGLAAGGIGTSLGLRPALWVAAAGFLVSMVPTFLSPVAKLDSLPAQV